jgi:hypothetical protein
LAATADVMAREEEGHIRRQRLHTGEQCVQRQIAEEQNGDGQPHGFDLVLYLGVEGVAATAALRCTIDDGDLPRLWCEPQREGERLADRVAGKDHRDPLG